MFLARTFALLLIIACSAGSAFAAEIHQAATLGDLARVQQLVAAGGAQLNAVNPADGFTPLHAAASRNKPEVARWLIAQGAALNVADANGATPLILAMKSRSAAVVELLLAAKADLNVTPRRQDFPPPLHQAIIAGDLALATRLLDGGADVNIRGYADGRTPLHVAASLEDGTNVDANGQWTTGGGPIDPATGRAWVRPARETILLLLERGARIDSRNAVGETPLCCAIRNNLVRNATLLLQKGADLNSLDIYGRTPIFQARRKEILTFLAAAGADVNTRSLSTGETPVQLFATDRRAQQLFLDAGADPNPAAKRMRIPDGDQTDRIFQASQSGDLAQVQALLKGDAALAEARVSSGHTPLHWWDTPLHVAKTPEVAAALLAAGAEVGAANLGGYTPLHLAAHRGDAALVKYLLAHGADPNAADLNGDTPLHLAAVLTHPEAVAALLEGKASPQARNHSQLTALERARQMRQPDAEVIRLLGGQQ